MKKINKWFTSIAILLLFSTVSVFLIISYTLIKDSLSKVNNYTDKTRAMNNSYIWIEDAKSFFNSNKVLFYDINKISPCDTIWSVGNYANYNVNSFTLDKTLHFKNIGSDIITDENLKDDQWFINRFCSLYTKWIPNKNNADFSILWDPSSLGTEYKWNVDENWYYNIWKILDNKWFWYFFTSDQVWENEINVKLDYNFKDFEWIDALNIYEEDLKEKVLLLKKNDPWLEVSKSNLKSILADSMYLYSDANLEIWLIEFNWNFDITDGFLIDKESWKVKESTHVLWNNDLWKKVWRLLCDWSSKTCELNDITLESNKVYFLYLKSFEKPTTYHLDITNKSGQSIYIPTNYLTIKTFWISNWILHENKEVVDISKNWWFFSDFSSVIYNYVYFTKN
jgi:hypothetical protein